MAEENHHQAVLSSDQHLQRWLSDRIVQLELARYELHQMQERLSGLEQYLDFLATHSGKEQQPLPPAEVAEREALQKAVQARTEEIQRAFEPTASQPFSIAEEMNLYCQNLIEVNERLALHHTHVEHPQEPSPPQQQQHHHTPALRDRYTATTDTQPAEQETMLALQQEMTLKAEALRTFIVEWNLIEQRLNRLEAALSKATLSGGGLTEREMGEYARAQAQEQALWHAVEVYFPEYRGSGQPYVDTTEMQEDRHRYRRAADFVGSSLQGSSSHEHLQAKLEELGVEYPVRAGQAAATALSHLQELIETRRSREQPSHQHQQLQPEPPAKSALRDLYATEEGQPGQPPHDQEHGLSK